MQRTQQELFDAYVYIADDFARRYKAFNVMIDRDDAHQIALLTLWQKALTFDESKCSSDFPAYLKRCIGFAITDELRTKSFVSRGAYKRGERPEFVRASDEVEDWHGQVEASQLTGMLEQEATDTLVAFRLGEAHRRAAIRRAYLQAAGTCKCGSPIAPESVGRCIDCLKKEAARYHI